MKELPIIESVRVVDPGDVIVTFAGRTSIRFVAVNNGSSGLDSILVSHQGKQVAYCNLQRASRGARGAIMFDQITAPATAELIGKYCQAAYKILHKEIKGTKRGSILSPEDHIRALDAVKGRKRFRAMKKDS